MCIYTHAYVYFLGGGGGGGNRDEGSITFVAIGFKPSIYIHGMSFGFALRLIHTINNNCSYYFPSKGIESRNLAQAQINMEN